MVGKLKGYDQLLNLVLDDVKETMRGQSHSMLVTVWKLSVLSQTMKAMKQLES